MFTDVETAERAKSEFDGHEVDGFSIGLTYAEDRWKGHGTGVRGRGRGTPRGGRGGKIICLCSMCIVGAGEQPSFHTIQVEKEVLARI